MKIIDTDIHEYIIIIKIVSYRRHHHNGIKFLRIMIKLTDLLFYKTISIS